MRDGLRALRLAVWCPFCRSSMGRYVHCELTRNELLDLTTIVSATACHQKNYVGTYSRSKLFVEINRCFLAISNSLSRFSCPCSRRWLYYWSFSEQ